MPMFAKAERRRIGFVRMFYVDCDDDNDDNGYDNN